VELSFAKHPWLLPCRLKAASRGDDTEDLVRVQISNAPAPEAEVATAIEMADSAPGMLRKAKTTPPSAKKARRFNRLEQDDHGAVEE
jgi:hypothetical protein